MVIFLCLTTIIRKQWVENEKLLVSNNPNSLRNNGTVRGNVWKASVSHRFRDTGGNRFNQWASRRPTDRTTNRSDYDLNVYFTQKPCNALGSLPIRFNSLVIGIAFLLPSNLLFSCVFFYFINKAQLLIGSAAGVQNVPGYPFFGEQGAGALFSLLVVAC